MEITVRDLTRIFEGTLVLGDPKTKIKKACVDSRLADSGSVFFALKGEKVDGHQFAISAFKKGATAAVVSRIDWFRGEPGISMAVIQVKDPEQALRTLGRSLRHSFKGPVVGITGSNGKTTTKEMTAAVLRKLSPGLSTQGNYNSQIGLPLVLSQLQSDHRWMVLEMGASAPGHIASLAEIAFPTVGILTSIGPAHLETFGSIEKIAQSKWELMESLPRDGCAILPWGEPMLESLVRSYKKKIIFFGENSSCPVRATSIETGNHLRFFLHVGSKDIHVSLPVSGRVNVSNALAAAAAGWFLGCSIEQIAEGLESFEPPPMRMQTLHHSSGAILINDAYNANPASMMQSIRSVIESYPGKTPILVLGSMLELGPDSEKFHTQLGSDLVRFGVSQVYLTGLESKWILQGAMASGGNAKAFIWLESKDEIAKQIQPQLKEGSVVFLKGSRGMELEKVIEKLGDSNRTVKTH